MAMVSGLVLHATSLIYYAFGKSTSLFNSQADTGLKMSQFMEKRGFKWVFSTAFKWFHVWSRIDVDRKIHFPWYNQIGERWAFGNIWYVKMTRIFWMINYSFWSKCFAWSHVSLFLQCVDYEMKINNDFVSFERWNSRILHILDWRLAVFCWGVLYNAGIRVVGKGSWKEREVGKF